MKVKANGLRLDCFCSQLTGFRHSFFVAQALAWITVP